MAIERGFYHLAFDAFERGIQLRVERHRLCALARDRCLVGYDSDVGRQQFGSEDRIGFCEGDHSAQLVLELADVTGPRREEQALHHLFGDADIAFLEFDGGAAKKMLYERRQLVPPLAQRRDFDSNAMQTVE
ncbi:MAG TPA: hypothetical protein VFP91_12360 [Vicinamibacterales bacterium]|nr:hypothetical protein [Vicinamibacterales bacterium]